MPDPITTAIATAVAGSAAQSLTTQAGRLLAEIMNRLQRKFRGHPDDLALLTAAQNEPGAREHAATLAVSLHHAFEEDPAFGRELLALWQHYLKATNGTVPGNIFNGIADKVIQVQEVRGDLTIN